MPQANEIKRRIIYFCCSLLWDCTDNRLLLLDVDVGDEVGVVWELFGEKVSDGGAVAAC